MPIETSSLPSGVSTLSGWNWMPRTFSSLCFSAIICPSSDTAVTSRQSGSPSRLTTHEW